LDVQQILGIVVCLLSAANAIHRNDQSIMSGASTKVTVDDGHATQGGGRAQTQVATTADMEVVASVVARAKMYLHAVAHACTSVFAFAEGPDIRAYNSVDLGSALTNSDSPAGLCPAADKKTALTALLLALIFPPAAHYYYG
jgi:hypothetical protein